MTTKKHIITELKNYSYQFRAMIFMTALSFALTTSITQAQETDFTFQIPTGTFTDANSITYTSSLLTNGLTFATDTWSGVGSWLSAVTAIDIALNTQTDEFDIEISAAPDTNTAPTIESFTLATNEASSRDQVITVTDPNNDDTLSVEWFVSSACNDTNRDFADEFGVLFDVTLDGTSANNSVGRTGTITYSGAHNNTFKLCVAAYDGTARVYRASTNVISGITVAGPIITVSAISGGYVNDTEDESAVTISGTSARITSSETITLEITDSGSGSVTKTPTVTTNAWETTLTSAEMKGLAEGTITVTASYTNATDVTQTFIYDATAPGKPTIILLDGANQDADTTTNSLGLRAGNLESAVNIEKTLDGGTTWTDFASALTTIFSTEHDVAYSTLTDAQADGYDEGNNTVSIRQTDEAGNVSAVSDALTFTYDVTAPTLAAAIDDQTATVGTDFSFPIPTGAFTDANTITYTSSGEGNGISFATDTWSGLGSGLTAGTVTITVTATDAAGNTQTDEFDIVISAAATPTVQTPAITLTSDTGSSDSDGITNALVFRASNLEVGATIEKTLDGGTTWTAISTLVSTASSTIFDISYSTPAQVLADGYTEGAITMSIRQTLNSNVSAASAPITFTYDTTVPVLATAIDDQTATVGTDFSFTIPDGTFTDLNTIAYTSSGESNGITFATDTWSGLGSSLTAGTVTIIVTATDAAGNTATDEFTITISAAVVTNSPPTINSIILATTAASSRDQEITVTDANNTDTLTAHWTYIDAVANCNHANFPTGFEADYAIAMSPRSGRQKGELYELKGGVGTTHTLVGSVNFSPNTNTNTNTYTFEFDFTEIGTTSDNGFQFVATYLSDAANSTFTRHKGVIGDISGSVGTTTTFTGARTYPNTWTGTTDTDWSKATNWTYVGGVPAFTHNILIPSTTNQPAISASSGITINKGVMNTGALLTMASGASLVATSTFSGNMTYNREINHVTGNQAGWYLMASPVVGETYDDAYVTANDIGEGTDNNRGIATYNTSANSWDYLQSNGSGTFVSGQGYAIKKQTSTGAISFTGTLNVDDAGVDVTLTNTATNRFNLIGNPYPSYLNSATFLENETAISGTQTLWVWNQTLSTDGAYEVKVLLDAFTIAPGQGFFVKTNTGGGTFNFSEANQGHATTDTFQKSAKTQVKLDITDGDNHKNYCKIYYSEETTSGFDVGYEGELFGGTPNPFAIYTHLVSDSEGKHYQIQSLPYSDIENMVIPVGVNATSGKEISISADVTNFPAGVHLYLEDKLENSFTQLDKSDAKYTVTLSDDLEGIGRFFLRASSSDLNNFSTSLENISVYTSSKNNLRIVGIQDGDVKLRAYNILGAQIIDTSFKANGKNDVAIPNLATGIYVIHLEMETGKVSKKVVVE